VWLITKPHPRPLPSAKSESKIVWEKETPPSTPFHTKAHELANSRDGLEGEEFEAVKRRELARLFPNGRPTVKAST
jgi:hypothetical protein